MAQANVAREPSMEEILASIRKIIESNDLTEDQDTGPEEVADGVEQGPSVEQVTPPVSLLNRIPGDRVEGSVPKPREPSAKETRVEPLAPLRPGLDSKDDGPALNRSVDAAPMPTEPDQTDLPAKESGDKAADAGSQSSDESATTAREESEVVFLPEAGPESDSEIDAVSEENMGDPAPHAVKVEKVDEEPRALISPAVGARVAASFGNLSQAVTSGPARSFDDIAEDMLRPMLQQWMDDNLPTLVERLVREEIERVARGR
ncbi:MAG: DUF2497 domain-containing protein [Alphaproteobacteria bacterium]|nr:DUF2497 domain-containing protein [Alphaproteobacteria bacterium]